MQSAARRAIKYKEQGKAKGAGTAVGWTRAGQLARGESLSLDTVKRMYSFFSRHEVDKKGKDWDNAENPSNGKIMWLAWGGDAGFSWSRAIVNREKNKTNKSYELGIEEEIKSILDDVINPITEEIEIDIEKSSEKEMYKSDNEDEDKWDNEMQKCWTGYKQVGMKDKNGKMVPNCVPIEKVDKMDDLDTVFDPIEKALRAEVTKEQLYMLVNHLHEAIEDLIDDGMDEMEDNEESEVETEDDSQEMEGMPEMEDANPNPIGDPNKNPINWPVAKSLWDGKLDPVSFTKRKFSAKERRAAAAEGHAMPDGSYPINNKEDLSNAIRSWGRGGADPKVKSHIKRRAKELGAENMIPDNWK